MLFSGVTWPKFALMMAAFVVSLNVPLSAAVPKYFFPLATKAAFRAQLAPLAPVPALFPAPAVPVVDGAALATVALVEGLTTIELAATSATTVLVPFALLGRVAVASVVGPPTTPVPTGSDTLLDGSDAAPLDATGAVPIAAGLDAAGAEPDPELEEGMHCEYHGLYSLHSAPVSQAVSPVKV